MKLNWEVWLYGLFAALIGGGASAIVAMVGVNVIDPKDWNFIDHPGHMLALMLFCFIFNGIITAAGYLKNSPLPQIEKTEKTTSIQPSGEGVKIVENTITTQNPDPPKGTK